MANAQKEAAKAILGGLFALAIFLIVTPHVEAAKVTRKTVIKSKFAYVEVKPTVTPTQEISRSNPPALTIEKAKVRKIVCEYFGLECPLATAVFIPESGLSCGAVGDNHLVCTNELMGDGRTLKEHCTSDGVEYGRSYGVAQIRYLPGRPAPEALLDCETNIKYAHGMWKAQGWYPWSAYTNKSYLSYL